MALSTLALLVLVALSGNVYCQFGRGDISNECRSKVMDVFFLLDSSTSIYINDYREQHQFVRDVISGLDIDDRYTRVGALTFSDDFTRPVLGLGRSRNQNEARDSITENNLPYRTGVTNTHLALRYVRESNEFRQDITKVMVVVTDGGSRQPGSTAREAQLAREQGFYLVVIGVGQYREDSEFRSIASDPDDRFIFNVTEFRQLSSLANSLPARICPLPPIPVGRCSVDQDVDVIFASGPGDTSRALDLIQEFAENLRMGSFYSPTATVFMEGCDGANRVSPNVVASYCRGFSRQQVNDGTFTELLLNVNNAVATNRQIRYNNRQVVVWFADAPLAEYIRFNDGVRELRGLANQANVDVIFVGLDLADADVQFFQQHLSDVINFTTGPVMFQDQALREYEIRSCDAINRRAGGGLPPFTPN